MQIQPLRNYILLSPVEGLAVTRGGLHIPDTAKKDQAPECIVIAVGPGREKEDGTFSKMNVKAGDRVMLAPNASKAELGFGDGEKRFLVPEEHILAVLT